MIANVSPSLVCDGDECLKERIAGGREDSEFSEDVLSSRGREKKATAAWLRRAPLSMMLRWWDVRDVEALID